MRDIAKSWFLWADIAVKWYGRHAERSVSGTEIKKSNRCDSKVKSAKEVNASEQGGRRGAKRKAMAVEGEMGAL